MAVHIEIMNERLRADEKEASFAWHASAIARVAEQLGTDTVRGLASSEAERRLAIGGPNQIAAAEAISWVKIFARQFASLVIWVLAAAALVSGLMGEIVDAVAIMAIVILNATIGFLQEYRAENAVAELKRMTAPRARVLRDGNAVTLAASTIVPGDLLLLDAGDLVAADARLFEVSGLQTNEAALTGESTPVEKSAAECDESAPLAERTNMVFLGTAVSRGSGRALVVNTGMQTEFGRIAKLLETATSDETPLQLRLNRVAQNLLLLCLGIVVLVFILGLLRSSPLFELFLSAVSLAVAAIPEGLPAIVTVALALGVSRMARRSALVRRLQSVETLGCAQVICTDKTGTLTMGEMTVRRIVTTDSVFNVTGEGYSTEGTIFADGEAPSAPGTILSDLLRVAVGCNEAYLGVQQDRPIVIGDPTEGALLVMGAKGGVNAEMVESEMPRVSAIPFTSDRKMMTVVRKSSDGMWAMVKGAPEVILERCAFVRTDGKLRKFDESERARVIEANTMMASEALRVIACAQRRLDMPIDPGNPDAEAIESGLTFLGLVGMQDPPRAEAREAVRKCHQAGIRIVMITGDHPQTASAIGRDLGILGAHDEVLTGAEIEAMNDEELRRHVARVAVYARVTAEHKLRVVRAWKSIDRVVAMTGDGVNDAPALKESAIGIAMGITGTEVTKQAADIVIADDNFASIVAAVEEGRGIYDNIAKTLLYLMGGNAGELTVMFAAALIGWPLPLLPAQLLWINLVTDGLPALALVSDPIDTDVLKRAPRDPSAEIIDREFIGWTFLTGCLSATVTLSAFGYGLYNGIPLEHARNLAFLVLVTEELLRSFGARSKTKTIREVGLFSNIRLLGVVLASFILQLGISATPILENIFSTERVTFFEGVAAVGLGAIPLFVLQAVKAYHRRQMPEEKSE